MQRYAYVLEIYCEAMAVVVSLNDYPVYRNVPETAATAQVVLNPWIVEGGNRLELLLARVPPAPGTMPRLLMTLSKAERGKPVREDEVLVLYRWSEAESPLAPEGLTPVFSHQLRMRQAFGRWQWEDARPYAPNDRAAVELLATTLYWAFAKRDLDGVLGLLDLKLAEMARAFAIAPGTMLGKERDRLQTLFQLEGWTPEPFDPGGIVLQPFAGGRLVDVWGSDGQAPIQATTMENWFGFELTVSRIGDAFRIVR